MAYAALLRRAVLLAQLLEDDMCPTGVLLPKYMHLSEIGGTQFGDFLFATLKR